MKQSIKIQETIHRHEKHGMSDSAILDSLAEIFDAEDTAGMLRGIQSLMLLREYVDQIDEDIDDLVWLSNKVHQLKKLKG
jgi:hypothetical protein